MCEIQKPTGPFFGCQLYLAISIFRWRPDWTQHRGWVFDMVKLNVLFSLDRVTRLATYFFWGDQTWCNIYGNFEGFFPLIMVQCLGYNDHCLIMYFMQHWCFHSDAWNRYLSQHQLEEIIADAMREVWFLCGFLLLAHTLPETKIL